MSTAKAVVLFIVGLLLAILVFPVAFFASAAFGYIFGVIALIIGVWLVAFLFRGAEKLAPLFESRLNTSSLALTQYDDVFPLFIQSCVLHFRNKNSLILTRSVKFPTNIYMLKESLSMHHY